MILFIVAGRTVVCNQRLAIVGTDARAMYERVVRIEKRLKLSLLRIESKC